MYQLISFTYNLISTILISFLILLVSSHLISLFIQPPTLKLSPKSIVVITGGCMGIGKQIALSLAKNHRCKIMIVDCRKDLFQNLIQQINLLGSVCQCFYCDLSIPLSISKLIQELIRRAQPITLLINNAGIVIPKKTWELNQQQHQKLMRINYYAPIQLSIRLLNAKLLNDGHIAIVSSMVAFINGGIDVSSYVASKHAIYAYMTSLRQELKKYHKNTTVSIACPYAINTTMFRGFETKLQFIFRILDQKYVGCRLARQFVRRKQICFIYSYQALLFKLISLFPSWVLDYCAINLDISNLAEKQTKQKHELKGSKTQKME